ncbi:hypothetical protein PHYSODRAFT_285962 [Phytophthora sojae]|uniref:RxLR effector protein n=1 Tax=Phytophthora sojae (strain P6497) TaxID=1094619 RepID=G4ZIM5_PHYSP|nr:hypothetical protein PHYSODRAFT_285962 [Phytophthora sojae]EGZ17686.1 hypothetical protein PHYSODRAFT_285962 [Phytophthora sojae]|eukprot:XP_009526744.1 hypothetical protein PHYSODRAFT_285962 [Phytophthora sojae]
MQRFLRSHEAAIGEVKARDHDEERGDLSGVSKLATLDDGRWKLTKMDEKLSTKIWLKLGYDPEKLAKFYHFDRIAKKPDTSTYVVGWFGSQSTTERPRESIGFPIINCARC